MQNCIFEENSAEEALSGNTGYFIVHYPKKTWEYFKNTVDNKKDWIRKALEFGIMDYCYFSMKRKEALPDGENQVGAEGCRKWLFKLNRSFEKYYYENNQILFNNFTYSYYN